MNEKTEKIEKKIPSKLELVTENFICKLFADYIPESVTPNMMTLYGAISGLLGIIFVLLSGINRFFLIGTCACVIGHLVCDDLDGCIARKRGMTSRRGAYFDLLTDILHVTYLLIAMVFVGIANYQIVIFLVPVYALIIFTSMNQIHYLHAFEFPITGPVETHIYLMIICICSMAFGNEKRFFIMDYGLNIADVVMILGGIVMYFEMIRLQIRVFRGLKKLDNE